MKVVLEDVQKTYRTNQGADVVALASISCTVRAGQITSLVGPSGCGKSTFLHIVAGLIPPSEGRVSIGDKGRPGTPEARPGIVFQKPQLMPWRNSLENVLLPAELGSRQERRLRDTQDRRTEEFLVRARSLLELVGLQDFEDALPHELSGGMQQRVAIARSLLLDSSVILMDEPFGALDEFTREQLNEELLAIWEERGFTCLFVTHNIYESVFLSDRILVMSPRPGRVAADITCDLPRPRTDAVVESEAFHAVVSRVRRSLRHGESTEDPGALSREPGRATG